MDNTTMHFTDEVTLESIARCIATVAGIDAGSLIIGTQGSYTFGEASSYDGKTLLLMHRYGAGDFVQEVFVTLGGARLLSATGSRKAFLVALASSLGSEVLTDALGNADDAYHLVGVDGSLTSVAVQEPEEYGFTGLYVRSMARGRARADH